MKRPDALFWSLGPDLVVTTSSPSVSAALDTVFGVMRCPEPPLPPPHLLDLDARASENGDIVLLEGGFPVVHADSPAKMPIVLESLLTHFAAQLSTTCAVFHAGVIAWDGRALLLPGERGSGKSTTTLWLASRGATYLSDDHAFVRLADGDVVPFAKAVTLKEGSFGLFGNVPTHADDVRGPVRYVLPSDNVAGSGDRFPIRALVFPQFDATAEPETRPVDPSVVALALVQQCFGGMEGSDAKRAAIRTLAAKPAWLVRYNDVSAFETEARRLWESLP